MDRFKSILLGANYAHLLVLGLVIKAIAFDVSYASFLLTIPVLGFEAYKLYIKSKKVEPFVLDAEVRKELDNMKSKLNATTLEKSLIPTAQTKRYF